DERINLPSRPENRSGPWENLPDARINLPGRSENRSGPWENLPDARINLPNRRENLPGRWVNYLGGLGYNRVIVLIWSCQEWCDLDRPLC
ncbi:MAG TPA: hypothetical protein DDW50_10025, partial [Firmicutes bacterium]|nr:hypothetical protein [Bacillota bacterium]